MPTYLRSDSARVQVTVSGVTLPSDSWSKMEGGDNVAETTQLNPGGMAPAVALGGLPKRSDMTVERPWSDALIGAFKALDQATGAATVTATYTNLDANKNPIPGSGVTYTGVLKQVTRPNYDASSSTAATLAIVFEANELIS